MKRICRLKTETKIMRGDDYRLAAGYEMKEVCERMHVVNIKPFCRFINYKARRI